MTGFALKVNLRIDQRSGKWIMNFLFSEISFITTLKEIVIVHIEENEN